MALACESTVLVNLSDGDLDGCVVLGLDDAVGGAALAGDVTEEIEDQLARVSMGDFCGRTEPLRFTYRSTSSPLSFSMFAVFVR